MLFLNKTDTCSASYHINLREWRIVFTTKQRTIRSDLACLIPWTVYRWKGLSLGFLDCVLWVLSFLANYIVHSKSTWPQHYNASTFPLNLHVITDTQKLKNLELLTARPYSTNNGLYQLITKYMAWKNRICLYLHIFTLFHMTGRFIRP